jgi:hypothetical protein
MQEYFFEKILYEIYIPHYFEYKMPSNLRRIWFLNAGFRGKN